MKKQHRTTKSSIPPHDRPGRSGAAAAGGIGIVLRTMAANRYLGARREADQAGAHLRCQASTATAAGRPARHPHGDRRVQPGAASWPHDRIRHADTETTPATGSPIAERFHHARGLQHPDRCPSPGVANAITQIANKYGRSTPQHIIAPSEAGENCSQVKFVWDGNGTNFAKAAVRNAVTSIGRNWLLLTND
jgi:hypothetical protein